VFTGIIEEVGTVEHLEEVGNGIEITVRAPGVCSDLGLGDSIAIDGVCQTVTALDDGWFRVQAVATTLGRTNFGGFREGRRVNLERSLAFGARLGGHLVQGHVDATGEVVRIEPRDELTLIDFSLPPLVADVTVLHGSITLNGISLTVNDLPAPGMAQVSIIPYTWDHTTFPDLRVGHAVNLEGDMIGKFVRHLVGAPARATGSDLLKGWGY
jgi:riboflavin synthase